ncbi:MAG: hypothetical protein HY939_05815 [Gammaproteobacteria bacterium]|nr:hypothetical protein [Gammaproteobacteria bacterium]
MYHDDNRNSSEPPPSGEPELLPTTLNELSPTSTSSAILARLQQPNSNTIVSKKIKLVCDKNLSEQVSLLFNQTKVNESDEVGSMGADAFLNEEISICEFNQRYNGLCNLETKNLKTSMRVALEKYKFQMLKSFDVHLEENKVQEKEKKLPRFPVLRKIAYYLLLSLGVIEDAVFSYVSGQALLSIIPGISNPFLIAGSLFITLLNCILFYAFEASMLKDALKIPSFDGNAKVIIHTIEQQIEMANKINGALFDVRRVNKMSAADYKAYADAAVSINTQVITERNHFTHYKESIPRKIIRWGVNIFGVTLTIAGSYFSAVSLLGTISASLVGTPAGWVIIALIVLAGLAFYFAMEGKALFRAFNPESQSFKQTKKALLEFDERSEEEFKQVYEEKLQSESEARQKDLDIEQIEQQPSKQVNHTPAQRVQGDDENDNREFYQFAS